MSRTVGTAVKMKRMTQKRRRRRKKTLMKKKKKKCVCQGWMGKKRQV